MRFTEKTFLINLSSTSIMQWPLSFHASLSNTEWRGIAVFPTPTVTSASSSLSTNTGGGLNPTILAAMISLGGVIVGLCITLIVAILQIRTQRKLAHQQEQLQRDLAHDNKRLQLELIRTQQELKREYDIAEKKSQKDHITQSLEMKRQKMLEASTDQDYLNLYKEALINDVRITTIQILEMSYPLEVVNAYVQLHVHHVIQSSYEVHKSLGNDFLKQNNPNALLLMDRHWKEHRLDAVIEPEDAIIKYVHCTVVGDPGAGKTTLLKHLTIEAIQRPLAGSRTLVPVYIELQEFVRSGLDNLLDFVAMVWEGAYAFPFEQAKLFLANQLYEGKVLLLFDALDETVVGETTEVAEHSYTKVTQAILQIATRYNKSPIIVTVRKASYHQRAPLIGFTTLEIVDFSLEDIRQFIRKWYASSRDLYQDFKSTDLITKLEQNPRLQTLAANPLLLTLILLVYEAQLDLPDRRAELYKRCIETLLTEWDAKRNVRRRREFKPDHKRQLLEVIAWHFHSQGQRYFPKRELLLVIATFLPAIGLSPHEQNNVLREIESEHGLLKEQTQGWYGFLHLTLQEYFAAQYVINHDQLHVLLTYRMHPWWEELLLLYSGAVSDISPLLEKLLLQEQDKDQKEDIFYNNLLLAGQCLTTRPTVLQVLLRVKVTRQLFKLLNEASYSLTRQRTAEILSRIGGNDINQELIQMLFDQKLKKALRICIIKALADFGERSVAKDLINLLPDQRLSTDLRKSVVDALGKLVERSVIGDLVNLLIDRSLKVDLRGRVVWLLVRQSDHSVVGNLMNLLTDQRENKQLRGTIAEALGELGERSVAQDLMNLLTLPSLEANLRKRIALALGKLGEPSVAQDLMNLLTLPSLEVDLRKRIAFALGKLGEPSVAQDLMNLLTDQRENKQLRGTIAEALGELGERSVAQDLMNLLTMPSLEVDLRKRIALALGKLGEPSVAQDLMNLLTLPSLEVDLRYTIAEALGELGERSVAQDLMNLLTMPSLEVDLRKRIALALGKLGEPSVARGLVDLLVDQQLETRLCQYIAKTIGELGERSIKGDLRNLLIDESLDLDLRRQIVIALGRLGERSIAQNLVNLLADQGQERALREQIIVILGKLGERSVAGDLVSLFYKLRLDKYICLQILRTLDNLGELSVLNDFITILHDNSLDDDLRLGLVRFIQNHASDLETVKSVVSLIEEKGINDELYTALWVISKRANLSIFPSKDEKGGKFEIIPWNTNFPSL